MMPSSIIKSLVAAVALLTLAADLAQTTQSLNSSVLFTTTHNFSCADERWKEKLSKLKAIKVERGCGRMQNRLVTFDDGSKACARFRLNTHLMQGEIYSHILGKLLEISNMVPLATTLPDINDDQWSRVGEPIMEANWHSNKLLILTKYISHTTDVKLPKKLKPMNPKSLLPGDITPDNADILAQWSDMIVFDYLVGNMDRIVNSLHNKQWNANIMDMPIHNLEQKDNSLIFFDNEDGLFHGYQIMDRYSQYHEQSLKAICIFRHSTIDSITKLIQSDNLINVFTEEAKQLDPRILKYLPKLSTKTTKMLHDRLSHVASHVKDCIKQYTTQ